MTPAPRSAETPGTSGLVQRLRQTFGDNTYAHIARVTGCNSETVRRYLNGGTPSVEFIASVADHFNVSADWLLLGRGPRRPSVPAAATPSARPVQEERALVARASRAGENRLRAH